MRLWSKIAGTAFSRMVRIVCTIIVFSITARMLGPDGRGVLAATQSWLLFLSALGACSLGEIVVQRAAISGGKNWFAAAFPACIHLATAFSAATISLAVSVHVWIHPIFGSIPDWAWIMMLVSLPFHLWERIGAQLLVCKQQLAFFNRRTILVSLSSCALVPAVILLSSGSLPVVLGTVLSLGAIASISGILRLSRLWVPPEPGIIAQVLKAMLKASATVHLGAIGSLMMTQGIVLILNYHSNAKEVAYFQMSLQITLVLPVLAQAALSVFNEKSAAIGAKEFWLTQRLLLIRILLITIGIAGGIGFFAKPIILLLAGPEFLPGVPVLQIMLLGVPGLALAYGLTNQWLGRSHFKTMASLSLTFAVLTYIMGIWLMPSHGAIGAAITFASAFGLSTVANALFMLNISRRRKNA